MQTIKKLYRESYTGEDVVTTLIYKNAQWTPEYEWIPNAITNIHTTSQAIVIGASSRAEWRHEYQGFDINLLATHKGGLFGADKLQTYGTNRLYKEFTSDFLIIDNKEVDEIIESGYCNDNIVYAHANPILDHPGIFYLIPQDPSWNAGTIAVYLACFDGHSKVYLMGFDGRQGDDTFYEKALKVVFELYPNVDFVRVTPTPEYYMPESWKFQVNLRQITFREFVLEADIG
jgi:hypothetical protein